METCPWLVQVASGNPEPDFPEDLYVIIECGAPLVTCTDTYWKCEVGHSHASFGDPRRAEQDFNDIAMERETDRRGIR